MSGIWEKDVKYNESADWIQKVAEVMQSNKQQTIEVPDWMTTARTVLLLKDKSKGNEVSSYRSITCLPLM